MRNLDRDQREKLAEFPGTPVGEPTSEEFRFLEYDEGGMMVGPTGAHRVQGWCRVESRDEHREMTAGGDTQTSHSETEWAEHDAVEFMRMDRQARGSRAPGPPCD